MERAKLEDISFDEEDANLFKLKGDLLLKAKGIQNSILPKLNVVLEEALSRVRKIYGIEVFNEDSSMRITPNFRTSGVKNYQCDYQSAVMGIMGKAKPIWKGFNRKDGKPVVYMGFIYAFILDQNNFVLELSQLWNRSLTKDSLQKFLIFLHQNHDTVQSILALSKMTYNPLPLLLKKEDNAILPFQKMIEKFMEYEGFNLSLFREMPLPVGFVEINKMINSFVSFYPIYDSMIRIAKGEKIILEELASKLKCKDLVFQIPQNQKDPTSRNSLSFEETKIILEKNVDVKNIVKPGMRWQIFERDDFKCVACGLSPHEGAILHVDHIVPRSKGGKDEMNNYQTLCHKCNIGKSNKSETNLRK